jgi:hypothetical protein
MLIIRTVSVVLVWFLFSKLRLVKWGWTYISELKLRRAKKTIGYGPFEFPSSGRFHGELLHSKS